MFLNFSESVLTEFFGYNVVFQTSVDFDPFFVMFLKTATFLHVTEHQVGWVIMVSTFVSTDPVPVPPTLDSFGLNKKQCF